MQKVLGPAVVAAVVSLLLVVAPPPASAHTTLETSSPGNGQSLEAAPSEIELVFSDTVEDAEVTVSSPSGSTTSDAVTEDGEVVTADLPDAGDGQYVVAFTLVATDGHPVTGEVRYAVGEEVEDVRRHLGPVDPADQAGPLDPPGDDAEASGSTDGLLVGALVVLAAVAAAVVVWRRPRRRS